MTKTRQIRIIGGNWRGSKLSVIDAEGLRPTPDRIRETLFNWLAADCRGASVLDCFAGSGALGLEAMSRGASRLVAIEKHASALANLRAQAQRLGSDTINIIGGDSLESITGLEQRFDIVFVDPPYAQPSLRSQTLLLLESRHCLCDGAKLYLEWPRVEDFELPSGNFQWLRRKRAGQINYAIAEWRVSS